MYYHLQIVHLIKMAINLLQDRMIELVKFGILTKGKKFLLWKDTKMLYIV